MRKALIAAAVATALFAVGAFAASFAVDAEDIASGNDQVGKCATTVKVDFDAASYTAGPAGGFFVSSADIKFLDSAGAATTACASTAENPDASGTLVVMGANNSNLAEKTFAIPANATGVDNVSFTAQKVNLVLGAAVLVENVHLAVTPIP